MAKGWSFGALTDALKSAAFRDVGPGIGQVVSNEQSRSGATITGINGITTSMGILGTVTNDALLVSVHDAVAGVPRNDLSSYASFKWYTDTAKIGITRGNGQDTLGLSLKYNDVDKLRINNTENINWNTVSIRAAIPKVGLCQANGAELGSIYYSDFAVKFLNGTRSWQLDSDGAITNNNSLVGENTAGIIITPEPGAFDTWATRAPALQINLSSTLDRASQVWKATKWGTGHIASLEVVAAASGANVVRMHIGNANFDWGNNGAFTTDGTISAGNALNSKGGVLDLLGDGNTHVWFKDAGGAERALIYCDSGSKLNFRTNNTSVRWGLDSTGFRNSFNLAGISATGILFGPGWGTTDGYDSSLPTWVSNKINDSAATKINQDNCITAGFAGGIVANPYMRYTPTNTVVYLGTRTEVQAKADTTYVNNQLATKAATTYVDTRIETRIQVDGCKIAGFASNDRARPYMRHTITDTVVYLAAQDWVNAGFVQTVELGAQGSGILGGSTGNMGNPAIMPAGCVMTGWYTEGQNPGGDTIYYRPIQKIINGVRTTIKQA